MHQNRRALQKQFQLTVNQAGNIILTWPDCQTNALLPQTGTNPHGTDLFNSGKQCHSCSLIWPSKILARSNRFFLNVSTEHTGEFSHEAHKHCLFSYDAMGIPHTTKTDNGPAYSSKANLIFLQEWVARHTTGSPHSPSEGAHHWICSNIEVYS